MALSWVPWITVVPECQRVAVFRAGRIVGYRGPGIHMRYLQTLLQVAESGNTVVFADPKLGGTALAAAAVQQKAAQKTEDASEESWPCPTRC